VTCGADSPLRTRGTTPESPRELRQHPPRYDRSERAIGASDGSSRRAPPSWGRTRAGGAARGSSWGRLRGGVAVRGGLDKGGRSPVSLDARTLGGNHRRSPRSRFSRLPRPPPPSTFADPTCVGVSSPTAGDPSGQRCDDSVGVRTPPDRGSRGPHPPATSVRPRVSCVVVSLRSLSEAATARPPHDPRQRM